MEFSGQSVLITGGGSGTGADMARAFAEHDATVYITGRRHEPLEALAATHKNINPIKGDVTDEASVAAMFKATGPCQIVIANAGIANSMPVVKMELQQWQEVMDINATGVFLTLRDGARQMQQGGRMIVISSILGLTGAPYAAHYTASKHAAVGLVRALAKEMAPKGITVNALCPGYLETEMTERSLANIMDKTGINLDQAKATLIGNNPQNRLIPVSEITSAALYLASTGAASINGQAISICGGAL